MASNLIPNFDGVRLPNQGNQKNQNQPKNTSQESQNNKPPPSEFWLNVGIRVGDTLVSLPRGIALDNLEAKSIPNSNTKNPEFRALRIEEAKLWNQLREFLSTLKPGQSVPLDKLVCEVRRIDSKESPLEEEDPTENPFATGGLF